MLLLSCTSHPQEGEQDVWQQLCEKLSGNFELSPDHHATGPLSNSESDSESSCESEGNSEAEGYSD